MENEKKIAEIREKIIKGIELAFVKLVKAKQKENGQLVFCKDGQIIFVDAKDINENWTLP